MNILKFPDNFWWGSATSAHQIEGDNHNDWSEWENSPKRIEELRSRNLDPRYFISGNACDSYNRFEEDFDIVKKLHQNIHRFSIEWSRIEPEEGRFDDKAMQHYIDVVKALKGRGIEPMITLWHFTNPIWFAQKGGFLNRKSPEYFSRYVKYVVGNLKDQVKFWITFNEPTTIYSAFAYLKGLWPPHKHSPVSYFVANGNFIKAHIAAYKLIKSVSHNVMVGFVENNAFVVVGHRFLKQIVGRTYNYFRNVHFIKKVSSSSDFIGLNYYNIDRKIFKNFDILPKQTLVPSKNWEIYPKGIYERLQEIRKFGKPIFITENGIPNVTDEERVGFIKEHLYWIWKAIQDGVDVRGYLYWSLLDNFEIVDGFRVRFGLVQIDHATFERKIRPSALEYAKICLTNQLEVD